MNTAPKASRVVQSFRERRVDARFIDEGDGTFSVRLNGDRVFRHKSRVRVLAFFDGVHHGAIRAAGVAS